MDGHSTCGMLKAARNQVLPEALRFIRLRSIGLAQNVRSRKRLNLPHHRLSQLARQCQSWSQDLHGAGMHKQSFRLEALPFERNDSRSLFCIWSTQFFRIRNGFSTVSNCTETLVIA